VGDFGVLAAVYRNTAARMGKRDRHPEAIRAALFAQALDPKERGKSKDVETAFHNWHVSPARKAKFADALAILALGLEVLPGNAALTADRRNVYRGWAKSHRDEGEWAKGAKVVTDAVAAHPGDRGLAQDAETHYLLWAQADGPKAAEVLREGLKAFPKSSKLKNALARAKKKDG
jgi:hypothetical protein